jgi:hypothetical protein
MFEFDLASGLQAKIVAYFLGDGDLALAGHPWHGNTCFEPGITYMATECHSGKFLPEWTLGQ